MRFIVLTLVAVLAGCDGPSPQIEVGDAWARATSAATSNAAVYMTIANRGGDDRLMSMTTPAAHSVTFHTMSVEGGVMRMRPISDGIDVAAKGRLMLAPNRTHIMLSGLDRPLAEGQRIAARLRFARSGSRDISISVVAAGAR